MIFPAKSGVACVLGLTLLPLTIVPVAAADELAWPPLTAQTRPWAWWWWHGSAVDETNIAHELQRFHDAGLGGVQITTIYGTKGADARDIPYLTPRWLAMMGSTVDQAHRLGLGVDMSLGSGWCFGGPTVSDRDANASVVVKTYTVAAGGTVFGKFNRDSTQALVAFAPDGLAIELTDRISANGEVNWIAPANAGQTSRLPGERDSASMAAGSNSAAAAARAGKTPALPSWTIYAISQKPSGQKVKRPAVGGEGWMLNPAYAQSVRDWLPWFDQALANYTGAKPEAVFQDSYEYRTDWAPDFFAQFEKLRGYKLQTELPALFAEDSRITDHASRPPDPDHIARVKYDYRRTISDIMADQSEPAWIDWAHKNGFPGPRHARQLAGFVRRRGHARNRDVPQRPQHSDFQVRLVRRAYAGPSADGRGNRHLAQGTLHRDARRPEISRRRHVSIRREPHFLPRRLLFAGRRGLAGLAVLCLHGNEPAQFHLA